MPHRYPLALGCGAPRTARAGANAREGAPAALPALRRRRGRLSSGLRHLEAYRVSAPSSPPGGWHALQAQLRADSPPAAPLSLRRARYLALAGAGAALALALVFHWLSPHAAVRVASLAPHRPSVAATGPHR